MNQIRIVTDTTCDLSQEDLNRYQITVVPTYVLFGTEAYKDGVTIDRETFMHRLTTASRLPTTAQPSPQDFVDAYERLGKNGDTLLSLHVTSALSGTYQSAVAACKQLLGRVRVVTFDSMAGSGILGWMCIEAARMAEAGEKLDAICERLEQIRDGAGIWLAVETLKYAVMGGRVPKLQGLLASVLDVKPIVALMNGRLEPLERVRSRTRQLARMVELAVEHLGSAPCNLSVMHADAKETAERVLAELRERLTVQESYLGALSSSLTVHFGPGTVGICAYRV